MLNLKDFIYAYNQLLNNNSKSKFRSKNIIKNIYKILYILYKLYFTNTKNHFFYIVSFEAISMYIKKIIDIEKLDKNDLLISDFNKIRNIIMHNEIEYKVKDFGIYFYDFYGSSDFKYNKYYIRDDGYVDISSFTVYYLYIVLNQLIIKYKLNNINSNLNLQYDYLEKSIDIFNSLSSSFDIDEISNYVANISFIFNSENFNDYSMIMDNLDSAKIDKIIANLENILKDINFNNTDNVLFFHINRMLGMAYTYLKNDYNKSNDYLNISLKLLKKLRKKYNYIDAYKLSIYMAFINNSNNTNNIDNARLYISKLFKLKNDFGILDKIKIYGLLANYYYTIKNPEKEYKVFIIIFRLMDKAKNNGYEFEYLKATVYYNYINFYKGNRIKPDDKIMNDIFQFMENTKISFKYKTRFYFDLGEYYYFNKDYDNASKLLNKFLNKLDDSYKTLKFCSQIYLLDIDRINGVQKKYSDKIDKLKRSISSEINDNYEKESLYKLLCKLELNI